MAYPASTDWPTSLDGAVTRTDNLDTVFDEDFNYPDSQIRAIQVFLGTTGELIGAGAAGQGPGGMVSPIADGASAIAFKMVARDDFVTAGGRLLSVGDDYDAAPPAYTQKFAVDQQGILEFNPITLPSAGTQGRIAYNSADDALHRDNGSSWDAIGGGAHASTHGPGQSDALKLDDLASPDDNTDLDATAGAHGLLPKLSGLATEFLNGLGAWATPAGGGGGNDSLPDIDQWVVVDKTTGSYTEDGTIQFPEDTIADAITVASGMSPAVGKRVGIRLMPGHYTEANLNLPSYVYVVGESRRTCFIQNTGANVISAQTNANVGWYNVTFQRTGSEYTAHAITIGADNGAGVGAGIDNVVFEDVNFDFDETIGIRVQGATAPSSVQFHRCIAAAAYDPAEFVNWFGSFLTTYTSGAQDHLVTLDDCNIDGDIWHQIGTLIVTGCEILGQVRVTNASDSNTDADVYIYRTRVVYLDVDQPMRFGDPWGALHHHTTGEVELEHSTLLGTKFDDGCDEATNYAMLSKSFTNVPSRYVAHHTRFGFVPPGGNFTALLNSIDPGFGGPSDYIEIEFHQCSFDVEVDEAVLDKDANVFPVGPRELYNSAQIAVRALSKPGVDFRVIKLMADDPCAIGFSVPDGQWFTLDLNGFTATGGGTMVQPSFAAEAKMVVQNGRMAGGWTLFATYASSTGDWDVTYRNIDIVEADGAFVEIIGGGSGAKLTLDNVRGFVGATNRCMRISDVDPTINLRGCYLKGSGANEAVQFDNVACTKFHAARCTFLHGSSGANLPFVSAASVTQGSAVITVDYCRFNADPTGDANISQTAESAYNIYDNALKDFLG